MTKLKLIAAAALLGSPLLLPSRGDAAMVAGWDMNESAGVIADASGNGINGTPSATGLTYDLASVPAGTYGAITLSPGVAATFDTSIGFTRASSGRFTIGNPAAINGLAAGGAPGTGAFTLMAWVFTDSLPSSTTYRVFSTGPSGGIGFGLANVDRVRMTAFGRTDYTSTGTVPFNGNWHHLALSWSNGALTTYVDGNAVALDSAAATFTDESATTYAIGSSATGTEFFNGRIDEMKVYNTAMSQSEVIAAATTAVPEPAGLAVLGVAGLLAARRRRRA